VKKILIAAIAILTLAGVTACTSAKSGPTSSSPGSTSQSLGAAATDSADTTTGACAAQTQASQAFSVTYSDEDMEAAFDASKTTSITLAGSSAKILGTGATVEGGTVTITTGGVYLIGGNLDDGQILVDAKDRETVRLVLDDANIACASNAAIYVKKAAKTIINPRRRHAEFGR
jgi:hypothetical protein